MFRQDELCNLIEEFGDSGSFLNSEDDFQFQLASRIKERYNNVSVEREYPKEIGNKKVKIDIIIRTSEGIMPIELKYKLSQPHTTPDNARYYFFRDVWRVEQLLVTEKNFGPVGYAVFLTNDPRFWTPLSEGARSKNAREFKMHEGSEISGTRTWWASEKKEPHRKFPVLQFLGSYPIGWRKFSDNIVTPEDASTQNTKFKYTVVKVSWPI